MKKDSRAYIIEHKYRETNWNSRQSTKRAHQIEVLPSKLCLLILCLWNKNSWISNINNQSVATEPGNNQHRLRERKRKRERKREGKRERERELNKKFRGWAVLDLWWNQGGQQCIFDYFWLKLLGGQWKLGRWEAQTPNPPQIEQWGWVTWTHIQGSYIYAAFNNKKTSEVMCKTSWMFARWLFSKALNGNCSICSSLQNKIWWSNKC